jgi:hypothetical protein
LLRDEEVAAVTEGGALLPRCRTGGRERRATTVDAVGQADVGAAPSIDGVPKRSTPFQAVVRLVRQHLAQPDVTVTESKELRDAVLGIDREVDIVIEGELDGEPVVISIEVIEHGRPATLSWVEQMLRKHRDLPTNRLLLVSKSGFSANALAAVGSEAGRVQALTPEVIEVDGQAKVKSLFVDTINYSPTGYTVFVRHEGARIPVAGEPLTDIYSEEGELLGPLAYLVQDALGLDEIRRRLSFMAHEHPEKDQVKAFSLGIAIAQLGYHLRQVETGHVHLIEEPEIWGDFAVSQTEVPLALAKLGERIYGAAEAPIAGRPAVWVGTTDVAKQTTTISWRTTDSSKAPPTQVANEVRPLQFPGLLTLFPLPDPTGPGDPGSKSVLR